MVLAGGASTRMGRDKLRLTVGGVPLVRRVYDVLLGRCEEVLVVGSGSLGQSLSDGLPEARTVPDLRPGRAGPLAGIEAGLASAGNETVFVVAGDLPFVPDELVGFLLDLLGEEGVRVAVPRHEGRLHPLCAAYRKEVLADLSFVLNLGVRAVHTFLENLDGVRCVEEELELFGDPGLFLMNVNFPEDLERARYLSGADEP